MASASAKAMPIIQIRTIWVPRLCHVEWCRKKREPTLTPPVFLAWSEQGSYRLWLRSRREPASAPLRSPRSAIEASVHATINGSHSRPAARHRRDLSFKFFDPHEALPAAGEQARILRKRLVLDSIMGPPIGGSALNRSRTLLGLRSSGPPVNKCGSKAHRRS
jgi:hypothetical protein